MEGEYLKVSCGSLVVGKVYEFKLEDSTRRIAVVVDTPNKTCPTIKCASAGQDYTSIYPDDVKSIRMIEHHEPVVLVDGSYYDFKSNQDKLERQAQRGKECW